MTPEEKQKRQIGQKERWSADTIQTIMATAEGRWWMSELLERCNMFSGTYRHDGDALGMAWRDGTSEIGRFMFAQLDEHTPDLFMKMIRERRNRIERARETAEEARKAAERGEEPLADPFDDILDQQRADYDRMRQAAQEATKP